MSCVSPAGGAAGGGVAVLGGGVRGGAELAAQAGGRGGGPARVAAAVGRGGPPLLLHPPQPGPGTRPGSQGHGRSQPGGIKMAWKCKIKLAIIGIGNRSKLSKILHFLVFQC